MSLSDINEDDINTPGDTVADILLSNGSNPITDIDTGDLQGFAVVGAEESNGTWQYSIDDGLIWNDFGPLSDTSAVLLNTEAKIRFLPNPDFHGPAGNLTVRAWDQTSGLNGSRGVDVSQNGGASAYSSNTAVVSAEVLPVNDSPVLELPSGIMAVFVEDGEPVVITGPTLEITDVDSQTLISATVTITNLSENEPDILAANTNGSGIVASYNPASGQLTLSGEASLAAYTSVLRAITFENRSQDPNPENRQINLMVNDGISNSNVVSSTVEVQPVNDPPVVDLNGSGSPGINGTASFEVGKGPASIVDDLELNDPDNTSILSATITLLNRPDGNKERLAVVTEGTNISAAYNPNTGVLTLENLDGVVNYEQVLRTLTYNNLSAVPDRQTRAVEIVVSDGESSSEIATLTIFFRPQIIFFPIIPSGFSQEPKSDEPNDTCAEAFPLALDTEYDTFFANDRDDWYSFVLPASRFVQVRLTNFLPEEGQLVVAQGQCDELKLVGHNGDFSTEKIIDLGLQPAGLYYIWIITDGPPNSTEAYRLIVQTN